MGLGDYTVAGPIYAQGQTAQRLLHTYLMARACLQMPPLAGPYGKQPRTNSVTLV